jgi:hypothetical protein
MKFNLLALAALLICSSELISGQTPDGKCGPTGNNQNCGTQFCCSQFGFCGTTTDHCGTGCQSAFGKCGTGPAPTSTSSVTAPTSTPGAAPAVDITTCTVPSSVAITFDDGPSDVSIIKK